MTNLTCKICNGQLMFLGKLGYLRHYICRNCGINIHKSPTIVRDKFDQIKSIKY